MNPRRIRIYIMLVVVAAIWGIAGPVIKYTLDWFTPSIFLTYRFLISAIIALVFIILKGIKIPKDPKLILYIIIYCLLTSTLGLGILFLGYTQTSAIDAGLIGATAPIFIAIAGNFYLHEHLTKAKKMGIMIAFTGTILTILEPALRNNDGFGGIYGNLLILFSVLLGTVSAVMTKIVLRQKVQPDQLTNFVFIIGLLTMLPITLFYNSPAQIYQQIINAPLIFHLGVFYMAIFSGTIAYYLWSRAEKSIEIGDVGVFGYLAPIFGTPLAVIWLGEKITVPFIIGAVIIAFGVVLAEYKKPKNVVKSPL